jgi:hypothetical protein
VREIQRTRAEVRGLKTTVICSGTTGVALLALALAKPRLVVPILFFAVLLLAVGAVAAFVGAAAGKTLGGLKEANEQGIASDGAERSSDAMRG